jgi:4-carboxymuconolactone decarboxylase
LATGNDKNEILNHIDSIHPVKRGIGMRIQLILIGIFVLVSGAAAQAPLTSDLTTDLHLRGDRFRPLTASELTPEQKMLVDHLLGGERKSVEGPFNIMLRDPEMGDIAQKLGAYLRFHTSFPRKLSEFAVLITTRSLNAQSEWAAHHKFAVQAGLSEATIAAVAEGKRPNSMQPEEEIVYNFCTELIKTTRVSDATFHAAVDKFGERQVVDLIALLGYYHMVSMMLNVDRYPLPEGSQPELKPLR